MSTTTTTPRHQRDEGPIPAPPLRKESYTTWVYIVFGLAVIAGFVLWYIGALGGRP